MESLILSEKTKTAVGYQGPGAEVYDRAVSDVDSTEAQILLISKL